MVELLLSKKTIVYDYNVTTSGQSSIGSLLRFENERGFSLDLYENESIPITFEIADVNDPSIKRSPFSKNFRLPGTKRNQMAMDYAYLITSEEPYKTYNGEVVNGNEWHLPVVEAVIYVDGVLAFSGKLELNNTIIDAGEINSFEVNFLATQINVFDELENKNMRDLNLPSDQITTGDDVLAMYRSQSSDTTFTVGGTARNGWTVAYPDWGFPSGAAENPASDPVGYYATVGPSSVFTGVSGPTADPANIGLQFGYNFTQYAYVKHLVDLIFAGSDLEYESDFFQSDAFQRLLLLAYDSSEFPSNTYIKIFGSNPSASDYYPDQISPAFPTPDITIVDLQNFNSIGSVPSGSPFNADENLTNPFLAFDFGTQRLVFPHAGTYTIQMKAVVDVRWGWDMLYLAQGAQCPGAANNNVYDWATYPLLGPASQLVLYCENRDVSVSQSIASPTITSTNLAVPNTYTKGGNTHYQWESSHDLWNTPLNFTIDVQEGDIWKFRIRADLSQYKVAPVQAGCNPFPLAERKYQIAVDALAVDVSPMYHNWNQTLPNISQKDFIVALIRHFNLYSEIGYNSRVIRIEPRDDFYRGGVIQDWTLKLDLNQSRSIARTDPPEEILMKMKSTSNFYDVKRQDTTDNSLAWGSYQEYLENGKATKQTVQSPFASTTYESSETFSLVASERRLVQGRGEIGGTGYVWNLATPSLYVIDNEGNRELTEQSDIYLAYRAGQFTPFADDTFVSPLYAHFYVAGATGVTGTLTSATGAYVADHLWSISSIGETGSSPVSVNFDETLYNHYTAGGNILPVYSDYESNYERYYKSFYDNLSKQKILTCQVRLDTSDIARFSFRNPIFINFPNGDAQYFIVNKIEYDPTSLGTSTVELLTFNPETFGFTFDQVGPVAPGPDYPDPGLDFPFYQLPPDQGTGEFPGDEPQSPLEPSPGPTGGTGGTGGTGATGETGATGGTGEGIVLAAAYRYSPPYNVYTEQTVMSVTAGGTAINPFPNFTLDSYASPGVKGVGTLTQSVGGTADFIYAGGSWDTVDGNDQKALLRFYTDGTLDTSWTTGMEFQDAGPAQGSVVSDSTAGPTGSIYILGGFDSVTGGATGTIRNLAHLFADGTVNTSFNTYTPAPTGPGFQSIAYDSSINKLYVTRSDNGSGTWNGTPVGSVFRLNPDATLDASFDTTGVFVPATFASVVSMLQLHIGATGIYLAGRFNVAGLTGDKQVVRLATDGTPDLSFDVDLGYTSTEVATAIYEEGSTVWIGGDVIGLKKFNTAGVEDATFTYSESSAYTGDIVPSASYVYINTFPLSGATAGVDRVNKITGASTWDRLQLNGGTLSDIILLTGA